MNSTGAITDRERVWRLRYWLDVAQARKHGHSASRAALSEALHWLHELPVDSDWETFREDYAAVAAEVLSVN